MSGTFQIGAILAAGGGFDFFTLIGVSIFFLLSFVAKRAQRAAEEKARREEEGSDSVPVQQAQEAKPKRQDFWGALDRVGLFYIDQGHEECALGAIPAQLDLG